MSLWRLGIDLGGTKIEVIVFFGIEEIFRRRIPTPAFSYDAIIKALASLVEDCRERFSCELSVGIGMPGALTPDGRVKNSNTVCLNGQAFQQDIERALKQPVRIMNDANCFAFSEAVDGAAEGEGIVFGVILGTGVGGGIVVNRQPLIGCNSIAGEWGHNPLPLTARRASNVHRPCYCGKIDCIETFLCGNGLVQTALEMSLSINCGEDISRQIMSGDPLSNNVYILYQQQLVACLATVINVLDPQVIVLGGGLSSLPGLATKIQPQLAEYVFSDQVHTKVVTNQHGDSSGVRGAAWLWPVA